MDHGETFRLLWYALFFLHARCVRSDVTCSAGNFTLGGPGSVRCNFGEVIQSKHNFNVVRYSGESSDSGDYVLLCNWAGTSLECTVKDGYSFDRKVDCSLTLAIAVVEERMAGMYVCQLVPDHGIPVHTCQLNVTAATEQATTAKEQLTVDPSPEHSIYLTYSISAVAVLLLAVAGFAIGLLVFLRCRNTSARKGNKRDQQNRVSKCCSVFCERVAIVFKLPLSANTEPVEEALALTEAATRTDTVHVQTADFGTHVTEDHLKQAPVNFTTTYVPKPPTEAGTYVPKPPTEAGTYVPKPQAAPKKPIDMGLHLPPLENKEPPRTRNTKRETTQDGGSSAHKKPTLPHGPTELPEKGEEAKDLLGQNPQSTSKGVTWYAINAISYIREREALCADPLPSPGSGPPATLEPHTT